MLFVVNIKNTNKGKANYKILWLNLDYLPKNHCKF